MSNKAKSHEDCIGSVCLLCMRKGGRYLNDFNIVRVQKFVKNDIIHADERVPRVISNSCRTILQK